MPETPKMRIHYIQGHLHRIEAEAVIGSNFQHVQMNLRIFMPSETDVANLSGFPGVEHGFVGPALCEDTIRIIEANHFVMLNQVDMVRLQTSQRSFRSVSSRPLWSGRRSLSSEKLSGDIHPATLFPSELHLALVIIPAVIHEADAAVNRGAHQPDAFSFRESVLACESRPFQWRKPVSPLRPRVR